MPENTLETVDLPKQDSSRKLRPERISDINGKIIRKLGKFLVDYPEAQEISQLGQVSNSTERIPTFDETPSGGLDMTREWGNTISSQDGEKSLRVQPPFAHKILEEGIHVIQGAAPQLDVRITMKGGKQVKYSNTMVAQREATRILNRLAEQLALKKKVLEELSKS